MLQYFKILARRKKTRKDYIIKKNFEIELDETFRITKTEEGFRIMKKNGKRIVIIPEVSNVITIT